MAGNGFEVNPEALAGPVSGLEDLAGRLDAIGKGLESTLDGLGQPWGDDKNGEAFFKQYGSARDQVLSGTESMVGAVRGVAKGIETMSKGFGNTENKAVEASTRLHNNDGSGGGSGGSRDYRVPSAFAPSIKEPGAETPRLMEAKRIPAQPAIPAVPVGKLLPREQEIPAHELEPRLRERLEPAIPAEERTLATVLLPTVKAEPRGFAELEPATLIPVEPSIPAERPVGEQ
jgi:uncharacterized protein YukE